MTVPDYFASIADELKRRSDRLRTGFSTHRLTVGENREGVVADFLREHIPQAFGVGTGLILSSSGEFSNQADLVIVDQLYNAPLFASEAKPLWLIESVYVLIEVKTNLSPSNIRDAVDKCRRFKTLPRQFHDLPELPKIPHSLFVLWAFDGPDPDTARRNVVDALRDVPRAEQPDFIVIPDSVIFTAGSYREISRLGLPDSALRNQLIQVTGGDLDLVLGRQIQGMNLGKNTLLAWLIWLTSWLKAAGHRSAPMNAYLTKGEILGEEV